MNNGQHHSKKDNEREHSGKITRLNNPARLKDIPPDFLWEKLGMEKADVLVEIGAGTALFSVAFLAYARPSKVYACELSEDLLDWMRQNVVPQHPEILPVRSGDDSVPLADSLADLVFMINVQHELANPSAIAREAYRILKPGGKILVVDWKRQEMAEGPPLEIRWLPEQVADELVSCGFADVALVDDLPKHFAVIASKR